MRASEHRCIRRGLGILGLLVLGLFLTGARHPAPRVEGRSEPVDVVRQALSRQAGRAETEVWEQRAYEALRAEGWMWARVRTVDARDGGRRPRLEIEAGPRARLARLELRGPDAGLATIWRDAAGLVPGTVLRPSVWDRRVRNGLRALGERGRVFASATVVRQETDPRTGEIDLVVLVRPGDRARIAKIRVEGATHTREEVLARLSGLRPGDLVRESALENARTRLEGRPQLVDRVLAVGLARRDEDPETVDLILRVAQPPTTGRFSAAVGAVRDEADETRLSGTVDLALLDLFGTARSFEGRWSDDGRARRRLDLSYLEPMVLGTGLDVRLELGQRHEDEVYDTFRGDLRVELPTTGRRALGFLVGFDRTTFLGELGRVRWRQRLGASFAWQRPRPMGAGGYGSLRSSVEAARVRDVRVEAGGTERVEASVTQTLVEFDGAAGRAFSRNVAARAHLSWRSTETDRLPLPRSEAWALGGATTVRGYQEERFLGERIAWGGAELVFGPARGGQAYGFLDVGWVQTSVTDEDVLRRDERWLRGFGLGVRSPTALGALDLSLGFAERFGFDAGKLHLVLSRTF